MASSTPLDATAREIQQQMDVQVALSKLADQGKSVDVEQPTGLAEVKAEKDNPTGSDSGTAEVTLATCAKCKTDGLPVADMICRDGYRVELRYVCKACHATTSQLQRNGINVQRLLGEQHLVQFFSEAALERRNSSENRLSWGQSRALLKKTMVHEVMSIKKDSQDSEWQPLSYYELKGYDTARIERECPCEDHPVLGATYKLSIHTEKEGTVDKDCEARLVQMENDASQRRFAAMPAPGVAQLDRS
eukprot:s4363_g2.t1